MNPRQVLMWFVLIAVILLEYGEGIRFGRRIGRIMQLTKPPRPRIYKMPTRTYNNKPKVPLVRSSLETDPYKYVKNMKQYPIQKAVMKQIMRSMEPLSASYFGNSSAVI